MNEKERNVELFLKLNTLKQIESYGEIADLGRTLSDDTISMKKTFTLMTSDIQDNEVKTVRDILNEDIQTYLKSCNQ